MLSNDSTTLAPAPASASFGGARREYSPHASAYDQVTNRIVALFEAGTAPWKKPWNSATGLPRNLISNRPYRGVNVFLLLAMRYQSPFWLTFRQASELGGYVRKGERATPVVFWKTLKPAERREQNNEPAPDDHKPLAGRPRIVARLYSVFNTAQCDGLKNVPPLSEQLGVLRKPAEIVANMPNPPAIKYGMRSAFYSPHEDIVGMPDPKTFVSEEEMYSALFHELTHGTGHKSRLNRQTLDASAGFGSTPYCKEELIAEMGAAFLCGHAGIGERTIENSAAYLSNWLEKLKSDKTLIISAAAQAQAAADYILGTKPEPAAAPEGVA